VKPRLSKSKSPGPDAAWGVKFLPPCTKCNGPFSLQTNVCGCRARKRMTVTLSQRRGVGLAISPGFLLFTGGNPFISRIRPSPLAPRFRHPNKATRCRLFRCRKSRLFNTLFPHNDLGSEIQARRIGSKNGSYGRCCAIYRHSVDDAKLVQ